MGLNKPKSNSTDAGFSLIELVVVIAVLGILVGISIEGFNGIQEWAAVEVAKTNLVGAYKECNLKLAKGDPDPRYKLPENSSRFEYPDWGADGYCLDPSYGNILTAARLNGTPNAQYTLNINVLTGAKAYQRAKPAWVDWSTLESDLRQ